MLGRGPAHVQNLARCVHLANQDKVGYETHLAVSDDLLHWERLGRILPFRQEGWDAWQAAGGEVVFSEDVDFHTFQSHLINLAVAAGK